MSYKKKLKVSFLRRLWYCFNGNCRKCGAYNFTKSKYDDDIHYCNICHHKSVIQRDTVDY